MYLHVYSILSCSVKQPNRSMCRVLCVFLKRMKRASSGPSSDDLNAAPAPYPPSKRQMLDEDVYALDTANRNMASVGDSIDEDAEVCICVCRLGSCLCEVLLHANGQ
jgi:hypothetical protein